jgi:hypothetical protein
MALICPNCTKNNGDSALHCKHCGTGLMGAVHVPDPSIFRPRNIAVLAIALLVFAGATGNLGGIFNTERDPETAARFAYLDCKRAVEGYLVAPTTANFIDEESDISLLTDGTYVVTGQVDSENRLGVPLRMAFSCKAIPTENSKFIIEDVLVLEP